MVLEESFEEEFEANQEIADVHDFSNNAINLPSKYTTKEEKTNLKIDDIYINNGNKEMDLCTKIAPESDR